MAGWPQEQARRRHVETAARSTHYPGPAGLHPQDQRQPNRGMQAYGAPVMRSPWVRILIEIMWILNASVLDPQWFQCESASAFPIRIRIQDSNIVATC
jgi:hypothetical protein